jgi:hypothetical protein
MNKTNSNYFIIGLILVAIYPESTALNIKLGLADFDSQINIQKVKTSIDTYFVSQGISASLILSSFYESAIGTKYTLFHTTNKGLTKTVVYH